MQQLFNDLMKQEVKPFLSTHGFTKKSLNFSRATEDLIYMFHFQKSAGSSADHLMFYVNCGIYSAQLAQIQSKEILTAPKEADCHFRARVGEIARDIPDRFAIAPDTNMKDLRETLLRGLHEVLHFYNTMTSARSIVNYYISGPYLHLGEESFEILLQSGDTVSAKQYLRALREKHGTENRWAIFENKYRAIFDQYGVEFDF